MTPSERVDVAVVGAGAVGLACAAQLASGRELVVIERHQGPGRETTSRNSGVVHAGIYYEAGSLKARACVEGRELLYARCAAHGVPFRKLGKLIVATTPAEVETLRALHERGRDNGAGELSLLDAAEVRRLEPRVSAVAGLLSPETGVVDVHELTESHRREAAAAGAAFAWGTRVTALTPDGRGWRLGTVGPDGAPFELFASWVVNAAGLDAGHLAARAGLDVDALGWRVRPCKGDYFHLARRLGAITSRLVYPVPSAAGLGVHVTLDLAGAYRAGPDTEYVDAPRYDVDPGKAPAFARALRRYLPEVRDEDLTADYAGVRPKLAGPGEPPRDFVLEERPARLIHLLGIESPGITASEALARRVADRVRRAS